MEGNTACGRGCLPRNALRSCGHWPIGVTAWASPANTGNRVADIRRQGCPTARRAAARGGLSGAVIKSPGLSVGFFGVAKREPAAPCRFRAITEFGPMFGQARVEASLCVRGSSCDVTRRPANAPLAGGGPRPRLSRASPRSIGMGEMPPTDRACRRRPRPGRSVVAGALVSHIGVMAHPLRLLQASKEQCGCVSLDTASRCSDSSIPAATTPVPSGSQGAPLIAKERRAKRGRRCSSRNAQVGCSCSPRPSLRRVPMQTAGATGCVVLLSFVSGATVLDALLRTHGYTWASGREASAHCCVWRAATAPHRAMRSAATRSGASITGRWPTSA